MTSAITPEWIAQRSEPEAPEDGRGKHDGKVIYRAGEVVRSDKYDDDPRVECTHGIHFFLTKEEAEAWL